MALIDEKVYSNSGMNKDGWIYFFYKSAKKEDIYKKISLITGFSFATLGVILKELLKCEIPLVVICEITAVIFGIESKSSADKELYLMDRVIELCSSSVNQIEGTRKDFEGQNLEAKVNKAKELRKLRIFDMGIKN